ncbi:MAG: type II CRISPR RNA-guided endonuclease Cas9 [Clostridia bacterium]|nr:type II CRISPR RNA-guided endonuclease Cas9 [Clostridia bacterium]
MSKIFTDDREICRYAIGLDVGVASVGYAVVALNSEDRPFRIIRIGSRVFDKAENPKTGASLALPRRQARSMRRRLRRQRHRLERIRGMIVTYGILTKDALLSLYDEPVSDVYELRVRALDELVTADEFARILINLAQRRGFKSNRKKVSSKEDGDLLKAVHENDILMEQKHYRTVGEMLFKDEKFKDNKRNKGSNYQNTVAREDIEKEARLIFAAQRRLGAPFASDETEAKYLDILLSQRSFAEGPAEPSPYAGNQVEIMRGTCTLKGKGFPRAPKASYSFQDFNLWLHLNHIRVQRGGLVLSLDDVMPGSRQMLHDYVAEKGTVTYYDIRKKLNLADTDRFSGVAYTGKKADKSASGAEDVVKAMESKKKLDDMKVCAEIRKCVNKAGKGMFDTLSVDQLDAIGEALSKNSSDERITAELQAAAISESVIEQLLTLDNFPKYGHISVAACRKLIPWLQAGDTYAEACNHADYNFKNDGKDAGKYLPSLSAEKVQDEVEEITSPVVKRAVSQTIKVVNAIIREMGEVSPVFVNLELARELSHSFEERMDIQKGQEENAARNETIRRKLIDELHIANPGGLDIVKLKLWEEQNGRCPYSGQPITIERLTEPGYVDVDHIVPYSRCFDDRMMNKVLVLSSENREKGNRLPLEYLTGEKRDRFLTWVELSHLKGVKKSRLLKERMTEEDEKGFRKRNLVDTQFISVFLNRYINKYLEFSRFYTDQERHVTCVNGAITAYTRARWGINKVRADGDTHHAVDALVIACISQSMVNRITRFSKYHETEFIHDLAVDTDTGEVIGEAMTDEEKKQFPLPWEGFHKELSIRLMKNEQELRRNLAEFDEKYQTYEDVDLSTIKPIFVSRMSDHKVTGLSNEATYRSPAMFDINGKSVSKTPLMKLTLCDGKDNTDPSLLYHGKYIPGYYMPDSDRLLYESLIDRLLSFDGKGEKAFPSSYEFHKPKADGTEGPVVRSVKIMKTAPNSVPVMNGHGIADNGDMVRTDVFYVEGQGYYFVPIYVADTVKKQLPNTAPLKSTDNDGKQKSVVVNDCDFCFSLYKNDLICVYAKGDLPLVLSGELKKESTLPPTTTVSGTNGLFVYQCETDRANAKMKGKIHDGTYILNTIGKTIARIEKYEVDVLGNIRKAGKEPRRSFN